MLQCARQPFLGRLVVVQGPFLLYDLEYGQLAKDGGTNMENKELIFLEREMGRALVAEIAPAELEFYDDLITEPPGDGRGKDHALGFGVPLSLETVSLALLAVAHFVLPLVIAAARNTVTSVVADASSELQKQVSGKVRKWIESRFSERLSLGLTEEQVQAIVERAASEAKARGLSAEKLQDLQNVLRKSFE